MEGNPGGERSESSENNVLDSGKKRELYEKAIGEIKERVSGVESVVPRMATVAAVLKDIMPYYFWCGFYFSEEKEMIVGPYQGSTACPNIAYSGVCGASVKNKETVLVPNVHNFPGHIACDERSNSEIVVPLLDDQGRVIAVFDVDSSQLGAFDEIDKEFLEKLMPVLLEKE
jgi:L-methionine (R)-S-oxide reductase